MSNIIGRKKEIDQLERILDSNNPEMVAVYGRRRVGKSFLISEFFKGNSDFIEIIGTKNTLKKIQIQRFLHSYGDLLSCDKQEKKISDWDQIFLLLKKYIDQNKYKKKIVIFFDEVPWLDTKNSHFLSALEYAWNKFFSKQNVKIIVCGSSASWMIKKIINNKAGLHNRLTAKIKLLPFNLQETKDYFNHRNITLEEKQIADLYMAIGGIPKYLSYVTPGHSVPQIIEQLFFDKEGPLHNEFEELYSSLFDNYKTHLKIVKTLSASATGLAQNDLIRKSKLSAGGSTVNTLRELEESGFLLSVPFYGQKKKDKRYRLVDEFTHFYIKWIGQKRLSPQKNSWVHQMNSMRYRIWAGYQFENICLKHTLQIKQKLGISGIYTEEFCWYNDKTQIDLLIDRADKTINLCEIKFHDSQIEKITELDSDLKNKLNEFKTSTKTKKLIIKTLISVYGTKTRQSFINHQVLLTDLFQPSGPR